jgi:hypothetical protein
MIWKFTFVFDKSQKNNGMLLAMIFEAKPGEHVLIDLSTEEERVRCGDWPRSSRSNISRRFLWRLMS